MELAHAKAGRLHEGRLERVAGGDEVEAWRLAAVGVHEPGGDPPAAGRQRERPALLGGGLQFYADDVSGGGGAAERVDATGPAVPRCATSTFGSSPRATHLRL